MKIIYLFWHVTAGVFLWIAERMKNGTKIQDIFAMVACKCMDKEFCIIESVLPYEET